ncbi:MAG TPA: hypothetical protein VK194_08630 [Candidatus Deferrimicrobium sp.]|nr:hypothetical protein [Candidatus Deferrimicrobium sp.]
MESLIPIVVAGAAALAILFIIAPKFLEPMLDPEVSIAGIPTGIILMSLGGISMFIGFMFIRRIVDIEV